MRAHQRVDVLLWLAVLAGMVTVAGACAFSGRRPGDLDDVGSGGHLGAGGYADGGDPGFENPSSSSSGSSQGGNGSSGSSSGHGGQQPGGCAPGDEIPASVSALLDDVVGFGSAVTGGAAGCRYRVTNLNDSGPGSLRAGAEASGPLWITFDLSGDITLSSPIDMASDKTIDGRGQYIRLFDAGIDIVNGTHNVIIENIIFKQGNANKTEDALRLKQDAHTVWIDHVSLSDYPDGLLDITRGSTDITVSWCKFSNHNKVMLIGANTSHTGDSVIRVTLHHNWFKQTTQRHPRLRFGKVHAFNNLYDQWGSYGAASSHHGELYSENNVYQAGSDKDAVLDQFGSDPSDGAVKSVGDSKLNGAVIVQNDAGSVFQPSQHYAYNADQAGGSLQSAVESQAGWRNVPLP